MLITSPYEEGETVLPSPNQLKHKIIIKNKKLPEASGNAGPNNTNDDDADSDFEDEQFLNEISSGILIKSVHIYNLDCHSSPSRTSVTSNCSIVSH